MAKQCINSFRERPLLRRIEVLEEIIVVRVSSLSTNGRAGSLALVTHARGQSKHAFTTVHYFIIQGHSQSHFNASCAHIVACFCYNFRAFC